MLFRFKDKRVFWKFLELSGIIKNELVLNLFRSSGKAMQGNLGAGGGRAA